MSWDVYFMRAEEIDQVADIPDDFQPQSMGDPESVRKKITESFPTTDWSDPTYGDFTNAGMSIEIAIGDSADIDGVMMMVRGGGDPIPPIVDLCRRTGWKAIADGEFIDIDAPITSGWEEWQAFRDRLINSPSPPTADS